MMPGSGLLLRTIAPASSVFAPLQGRSMSLAGNQIVDEGAWARARQSRDQASVIWGKLLNLSEVCL